METSIITIKEYPLSSYQKDIWFEQCMYPGKPIYNIGGYVEVKGNLDIAILKDSMQLLIRQNNSLSTRFTDKKGEPYLTFLPEVEYEVPLYDFSMKENPNSFCTNWMKEEFLKPFQSENYYFQFDILQEAPNIYFIFLKVHHLVIDGWGFALLVSQMFDNYNKLTQGISEMNRTVYSYADFISDNQDYLNSPAFLKDREFWKNKYQIIPEPLLSRGADIDDGDGDSVWSDRRTLTINKTLYNRMIEFCKEEGCSSFHYFLGILFLYFSRVSNRNEMVIGVPVFNRGKAKYKQTMGHFANVLPLRISPEEDISFKGLIKSIKRELMQCYRHQKMSFGEIYRTVYENVHEKGKLFDISLSFEEQENRETFIGTATRIVSMPHHHERNALNLFIWGQEGETDVAVNFDYQIQAFERFIPIENVIRHFEYLFAQAMEQSETLISQIGIVPEEESSVQLHDFNRTGTEYRKDQTIHGLFEERAEQRADHPALVWGGQTMTYRELNEQANRLAAVLRARGVKPDDIVAIMTERSMEMVIGILGALKAGGAYLPIDPNYPEERIHYMLEDSGASMLLTQKHLRDKLVYHGPILDLDGEGLKLVELDGSVNPPPVNKPEDLSYIIYTSGSTGKPKGVMVEHRGVINLQHFFEEKWGVGESDRMLQFASSSFDASVWEIFTILLGGGTLYLVSRDIINNLNEFARFINENQITIALLPPTYLAGIEPDRLPALKKLVTGGSAITKELVTRWKDSVEYMNAYGPSESSVIATAWTYREEEMGNATVPIGKPIANTRIYIMDNHQKLLPIGAAGEMCVAGDGLARGYLHRPELTAEKFVANPYEVREKLYRTGDLVRWLPDGNIEFLGRIDDQVKIRGFRIELGEIEAQLMKHPLVREVAVIAREDKEREKYLAAYFTAEGEPGADELREQLLQELPDYMVPSSFMQLDHMPMTPSGKIDRKTLPEPDLSVDAGAEYVAPRDKTEEILAGVWENVLKVERVGIRDHFLNLGGDSIKAIQVVSKLHDYKLKLQLKDLFDHPVIEQLSAYAQSVEHTAFQGTVTGEIIPTPIQSWLLEQPFAAKHHFNQSVLLHRKQGFDEKALRKVFDRLVEHHDALRIVVREKAGQVVLFNRGTEGELYSLKVKDFTNDDTFDSSVKEEAAKLQSGMDLVRGPLVQAGLFKTRDGDYLCVSIHHLVVDGISWRILFEDISTGYRQAEKGEEVTFREKTDSFLAWSEQLYAYAGSGELLQEITYWRALEQNEIKPIPKDHTIHSSKYMDSDLIEIELDEVQTIKLLKEVNKAYNTEINDVLLTALGEAIGEWTGENKVLVNLEGHGREEIIPDMDISRTVGWFTAQYPVILDMAGAKDVSSRLKAVKESLRRIPQKGIGYGILEYQTILQDEGILRFDLHPEISFNYLGQFDQDIDTEIFTLADVLTDETISPDMQRPYCLDINGRVTDGKLRLSFAYHKHEYEKATLIRVAEGFKRNLEQIIEHCVLREYTELTASDVSSRSITMEEIEEIYRAMGDSRSNITDIYTLTPMQTGMLYHFLREQNSHAYFEQAVLSLKGEIDISLFERAFQQVVQRHDILRTAFVYEKLEKPVQVVLKERPVEMSFEYISYLTEREQEKYLEAYLDKDREKGFDLTREPLIRMALIRMSANSYRLIWSFHHIIMDGWCFGIVFKELLEIYSALHKGSIPQLGTVYPYRQYIQWMEQRDDREPAVYWENYLTEYEQPALLPKTQSGTANPGYIQEEYDFTINREIKASLERIARESGATLSTVIQAVWGILLQRYNNTRDVVFGTVVSGRPAEIQGVERMVGLFINTIPVRVRAEEEESFSTLIAKLQREAWASEQHHYYPLAEIQSRTAHGSGLLQNLLAFENYPMEEAVKGQGDDGTDLRVLSVKVSEQTNFDFNFIVVPENDLQIKFRYNSLAYDRNFMERVAGQIKMIIREIIRCPKIRIADIEIVPEEESSVQLHDFNRTGAEYRKEQTIHGLFEERADQRADHPALVWGEQTLSYRELNEQSNRLATVLRARGVKPDDIVAIMTERSMEMVIGILGTLKAGGAYLPIDPSYPEERIHYMLEDSGASMLLTQKHLRDKLAYHGPIMDLDGESLQQKEQDGSANPQPVNKPEDLAYIIYTSGSTGKPKGVMVEHRGIINLRHFFQEKWGVDGTDRMLQFASSSFDASVWEMFTILLGGGTLYLVSRNIINNLNEFARFINEKQITIALLPPTYLAGIEPDRLPALKKLVTGGSAITKELVTRWKDSVEYMNAYGPSESSVIATAWTYREEGMGHPSVPIGKPIANTRIYILDQHQKLLPLGAAGEMCVAGDGLARGYLHRPEMTAEKFVSNPYEAGEKLYRTGDLVRWLPDGNIEFLGRIDDQVKIRGFRIELGEIEAQLQKHPLVREVAVIAREDKRREKYLAAYFTAEGEPGVDELREQLLQELPDYMVPSSFMQLDHMLMTPSGKIDRKVLPEPEWQGSGDTVTSPRNDVDLKIQKVWQEILGMQSIGIDDNFFRLGGNSIKAIQVVSRLALDFEVGINDIFQYPTIRTLADNIKYSKDRLKQFVYALREAAATGESGVPGIVWKMRESLKEYRKKNQAYKNIVLSERADYRNVLLVGGTGYLGIHILFQLLQNTEYKVYVPVRGTSDEEALRRLWAKLKFHFGLKLDGQNAWEDRVCVFCGDLTQDCFGLSRERYESLAGTIDVIINSAANVKHFGHYSEFHAVNVEGNERLIEFAGTGKKKTYNFVSTTSVGSGWIEDQSSMMFTEYDCNVGQSSDNYYVMTKLEAEKEIARAREEGLDSNVFRVGNLVFDSNSGVFQENISDNAFYSLVKSMIKLGRVPAIRDKTMNFSFVDEVAEAVVLLFDRKNLNNETYHLFNSHQVSMMSFAKLLKQADIQVQPMQLEDFTEYMFEKYDEAQTQQEVARILVHSNVFFEGASKTVFMTMNQKTDGILQTLGFEWSRLDGQKVKLMMDHVKKVGFM
ncbi:non-ribosomal peptide synthetase [Paenibacillus polymyxa]|uniref:non-ribosomal peptide synthetase n=1 Tax=Paenibacillus polymyxa TaxID=1406 RepID=UPI002AB46C60|nr:non-ribosomal peptide synthetase [Paenibacillus polymyxa]MDY8021009.1 amino acid adenylation domain-containing protein [Paenibacillus polymyxa]